MYIESILEANLTFQPILTLFEESRKSKQLYHETFESRQHLLIIHFYPYYIENRLLFLDMEDLLTNFIIKSILHMNE